MGLGERLRKQRDTRGWTQEQLGGIMGLTAATINRYEREQRGPDLETLWRLADLFDVSVDFLLGRTTLPNAYYESGTDHLSNTLDGMADQTVSRSSVLNKLTDETERLIYSGMLKDPRSPASLNLPDSIILSMVWLFRQCLGTMSAALGRMFQETNKSAGMEAKVAAEPEEDIAQDYIDMIITKTTVNDLLELWLRMLSVQQGGG